MNNEMIKKYGKWWILSGMILALSMILIDQGVSPIALPGIQRDLHLSGSSLYWVINAYLLAFAVTAASGGRLGDIFGRVKSLVFGVVLYLISTACCGFAANAFMLITARAFQGIAAAFFITASVAIINTNFELEERGKAMAYFNSASTILMIVGTLLGGFVINCLSWRWAYFINVPVAIAILLIVMIFRPKDEIMAGQKVDIPGLALLVVSITSIVLAVQQVDNWGWKSGLTLGLLAGGMIVLSVFVAMQRRQKEPLLNFNFLKDSNFAADVVIWGLTQFVSWGQGIFGMLYLQNVLSLSPAVSGIWSTVTLIIVAIFAQFGGRIYDKTGARLPVILGAFFLVFGYLWQAPMLTACSIYYLIPGMISLGVGFGLLMTAVYTDAMNRITASARGEASGVLETVGQIGGTIGVAACSTIVSMFQVARMKEFAVSAGISPDQAGSLAGILSETQEIQKVKASLISTDWQGLITHLKIVVAKSYASSFYLAGVLMLISLVIAAVVLKRGRQTEEKQN